MYKIHFEGQHRGETVGADIVALTDSAKVALSAAAKWLNSKPLLGIPVTEGTAFEFRDLKDKEKEFYENPDLQDYYKSQIVEELGCYVILVAFHENTPIPPASSYRVTTGYQRHHGLQRVTSDLAPL